MNNIIQDLQIESINFLEEQLIDPRNILRDYYFKDGSKVRLDHRIEEVAISASNQVINIPTNSNVVETWIWAPEQSNNLTATFDSDPVVYQINPLQVRSGQISTITVSNSLTTDSRNLAILQVIVVPAP